MYKSTGFAMCLVAGIIYPFTASADVVLVNRLPQQHIIVPAKVIIEPLTCPDVAPALECATQATPRGVPSNWITIDDYPARARQKNQSGAVGLQLVIDAEINRPKECSIIQSSGFELLDSESCAILERRARFWPDTTSKKAAPSLYNVRVVWIAPWVEDFYVAR
jgi:TonB family protein